MSAEAMSQILHVQLKNMDNQKRDVVRKGAAEILSQMIRFKNKVYCIKISRKFVSCKFFSGLGPRGNENQMELLLKKYSKIVF